MEALAAFPKSTATLSDKDRGPRPLLEGVVDAVILADPGGRIIDLNRAAEDLFGYTKEEMQGRSLPDLMPAPLADQCTNCLNSLKESEGGGLIRHGCTRFRGVTKTGVALSIQVSSAVLGNNGEELLILVASDISEWLKQESELFHFTAFIINNPNPIFEVDRNGTILYLNPAAAQLLKEMEVTWVGIDGMLPPEFRKKITESLGSGKDLRRLEVEIKNRWFGWSIYPLPNGLTAHLYGTDLTAIKKAEEKAHALKDELIQAEKLSSMGTLVSGITHEINNPLYGILGTAEFILDEEDPKKIPEHAKSIIDYSKHIATIVREFACYARPASLGNESLVDLNERLDEAVKMVRHGPHFREVRVERQFEPVPHILARPGELQQVFVNLISNAVQAMNGTGCLTLTTQHSDNSVRVRISDTGNGIPAEFITRIFDPFFTTKDPGKGTGLGLSIVHKIITKYHGHISVESQVGKGTTFTLQFATQPSDR